jgi:hypothetical protein
MQANTKQLSSTMQSTALAMSLFLQKLETECKTNTHKTKAAKQQGSNKMDYSFDFCFISDFIMNSYKYIHTYIYIKQYGYSYHTNLTNIFGPFSDLSLSLTSHYVAQAGLELVGSSNPSTSASTLQACDTVPSHIFF